MQNRVSTVLTQAAIDNINRAIDTINQNLNMLIGLSREEAKALQGIDSIRYSFVKTCFELVDTNNTFKPEFYDPAEAKKDFIFHDQLGPFETRLSELTRNIMDTRLITGHESYSFSRAMYDKIQTGAKKGIPGFKNAHDQLKPFFEKQGAKKKTSKKMKNQENTGDDEQ